MAYDPADPYSATVADLLHSCLSLNAQTMKLTGDDAKGRPVFLVFVAVKEEAARLAPEIERLTADEAKRPAAKRSRKRRSAPAPTTEDRHE